MTGPAGSIRGKDDFIRRIAVRLGRGEPLKEAPPRDVKGVPEFYRAAAASRQELIDRFVREWTALSGKVRLVPRGEAAAGAAAYLEEIVTGEKVEAVSLWDDPEIAGLGLEAALNRLGAETVVWRESNGGLSGDGGDNGHDPDDGPKAEDGTDGGKPSGWRARSGLLRATERCRLGVVCPDYAIANTGTLVLQACGGRGRSVSLLPSVLLAVFPAERLVMRMGEALERLRSEGETKGGLPSSITLVTGPSRSADIENDLTIGVHGPGKVHALILV